jgi:hypothetical protein
MHRLSALHGFVPAARKICQDITEPYGRGFERAAHAIFFITERCRECAGKIVFA